MNIPGKTSFWPFWPFLGQKYIACGDKMVFSEVFGLFLPIFRSHKLSVEIGDRQELLANIMCHLPPEDSENSIANTGYFFLVPRSAVGTYGLVSVRPFLCPSVRSAEISKSVHRNFFIFGTKLGLPNATEVTFSDFGLFLSKNDHFWPKINVLANFSKSVHRIFLILHI